VEERESGYGLDSGWEHERRRLELLEEVFDASSRARLVALGLEPGARCLELGGGGGSITRWLCREVGETGHVTVVDLDTRWLDQLDEPNLTVVCHDVTAETAPFAGEVFDFIHARAVLEHIRDREAVLERICGWLAPGGWVYLEDCASFSVDATPSRAYGDAMSAWIDILGQTGTDYEWGRTFPLPLMGRVLEAVGAEANVPVLRGGSAIAEFWSLTIESLRKQTVDSGLITDQQIDDARALLADPEFWDLSPAFVGAWGRRATE